MVGGYSEAVAGVLDRPWGELAGSVLVAGGIGRCGCGAVRFHFGWGWLWRWGGISVVLNNLERAYGRIG